MQLKPLNEQVAVVVGASSGIGRAAALKLAAHGAKVVVAVLSEPGLIRLGRARSSPSPRSRASSPCHSTPAYAASEHAAEGAMDALRRELLAEGVPISVTRVKPATINTPLFTNSRNKMDVKPKGPPPIYRRPSLPTASCTPPGIRYGTCLPEGRAG